MQAKDLTGTLINNQNHNVMMAIPTIDNETEVIHYKVVDIESVSVLGCDETLIILHPKK